MIFILCHDTQGGQGEYNSDGHMFLSLALSP